MTLQKTKNILKTNTAIGRYLSMLEDLLAVAIHHNTLRKAFFHFWAMTRYTYDFSCIRCGHEPPILIADGNWKAAFDLPGKIFIEITVH